MKIVVVNGCGPLIFHGPEPTFNLGLGGWSIWLAVVITFLSEPVKGKPPYGGGWLLPPVQNLRTALM